MNVYIYIYIYMNIEIYLVHDIYRKFISLYRLSFLSAFAGL